LSHLSSEEQELLLLRYVNNESVGTISETMGISRFALYRRLKSAENKLRNRLEVDKNEK
jgi:RNA polymerase sigma-70 factor (ECF subfamily)